MAGYPTLIHTALDAPDCRALAEFYRELLGLSYRPGDEPRPAAERGPATGTPGADDADWLVLLDAHGRRVMAVQRKTGLQPSTWPSEEVPMQMHMDFAVPSREELERHRRRAEELGGRTLSDRTDDPDEPLYVMADPAGHPFCLLVR